MIKFNSLKVQISVLLIAIILALNILILILAHNIVKSEFNTLLRSRGENILSSISSTLEFSLNAENPSFLESTLSELSTRKDILFLTVYDLSGNLFTEQGKIEITDTLGAELMVKIKEGETITSIKEINFQKLLDCYFPVYGGMRADKVIGVFRVGISLQESFAVTKRLSSALLKILLAVTVIALLGTLELLNYFFRPLNKVRENLKNIAEGRADIHVRLSEKFLTSESKELASSFNLFVNKLEKDKDSIRQVAERISAQAEELSASAEEMTASSEEVSSTMEQIAHASEKQAQESQIASGMSQKALTVVRQSLDSAQETLSSSENISELSEKGKKSSEAVRVAMDNVTNTIHELEEVIQGITRYSEEILGITEKVREISKRTNILALNATIEATKAGETGRGFAVVADEIRKLANQSSEATRIISEITNEISGVITSVTQKTQETVEEVDKGKETSLKSADFLKDIAAEINHIIKRIRQIAEINKRGEEEVNTITEALENIAAIAEENAASSEELSAAIEELSASVEELSTTSQETAEIAENLHKITSG